MGLVGGLGGLEKLILKLTSASTEVGVEARAELGNLQSQLICMLNFEHR